ncbi:hypothetical protein HPB47_010875, partial [Ixodes persulcatus]
DAPTHRLLDLGILNTIREHLDAHHMSQLTRLASSPTGHYILDTINILPPTVPIPPLPIPPHIRNRIRVHPIPRQMHPTFHKARRLARAHIHAKLYPPSPCTLYTDATPYPHNPAHCVTVLGQHPPPNVTAATILTTNTTTAEEAAIALALAQSPTPQFVLSDSQQAIRNFIRGNISPWPSKFSPTTLHPTPDITLHYRLLRRQYPPPHPHLSQEAAHMLRLLQTHTFPHRTQLIHAHPHLFTTPACPACGALDTHYHSLCECPADPYPPLPSPHLWEQMLRDPEESTQVLGAQLEQHTETNDLFFNAAAILKIAAPTTPSSGLEKEIPASSGSTAIWVGNATWLRWAAITWLELVRLNPAGYSQAITFPPRENEDEDGTRGRDVISAAVQSAGPTVLLARAAMNLATTFTERAWMIDISSRVTPTSRESNQHAPRTSCPTLCLTSLVTLTTSRALAVAAALWASTTPNT